MDGIINVCKILTIVLLTTLVMTTPIHVLVHVLLSKVHLAILKLKSVSDNVQITPIMEFPAQRPIMLTLVIDYVFSHAMPVIP